MSEGGGPPLAPQLVRDARVEVLGALEWVDRPLSVRNLMPVLGYRRSSSLLAYHLSKLVDEGALEVVATRALRESRERFFFFATWDPEALA